MRLALTLLLLAACKQPAATPAPVRVAAASDLSKAFEELAKLLPSEQVTFSFGASGQLSKQLVEGAPFDVFAAANVAFAEAAVKAGACEGLTPYARGRLVVFPAAPLDTLGDPRFKRIGIANPETAPYGKAAKQALTAAGLWDTVQPRLVYGENVRQTLQLAQTGNVEAAIVAHSLAPDGTLVDAALHEPLVQALVVCTRGGNRLGGEKFIKLLLSAEGTALMKRHGFEPP